MSRETIDIKCLHVTGGPRLNPIEQEIIVEEANRTIRIQLCLKCTRAIFAQLLPWGFSNIYVALGNLSELHD